MNKNLTLVKHFFVNIVFTILFIASPFSQTFGQNPLFGLVGFATQNGGTTGGTGGTIVTVSTFSDLKKYAETKDTKYIIHVSGRIYNGAKGGSVSLASNKSIIGMGADAFLDGIGLGISGTKNIIIQNIKFTMTSITDKTDPQVYSPTGDEGRPQILVNGGDCITISGSSKNIWIDHCEFYNIDPKVQTNQDLYDGLIDAKNASAFITISWCYFHDHHKCSLIGSSDSDTLDRKITFHHNYYKNISERMPLYRYGTGHFFNNYVNGTNSGSAVNSRMKACVRVEQNVFEGKQDPIITKNSAIDGYWDLADNSNLYINCKGNQPKTSTCTFNPSYTFSAILSPVAEVKNIVIENAGVGKIGNVTGIVEDLSSNTTACIPNPFTHEFMIQTTGEFKYQILDIKGVTIESGYSKAGEHFGKNLQPGIYFVKIEQEGRVKIMRTNKL